MINGKIKIQRFNDIMFIDCPFCDGKIPVEFEPLYNDNQVRVKGKCKKCESYIQVRTHRFNVVTDWLVE